MFPGNAGVGMKETDRPPGARSVFPGTRTAWVEDPGRPAARKKEPAVTESGSTGSEKSTVKLDETRTVDPATGVTAATNGAVITRWRSRPVISCPRLAGVTVREPPFAVTGLTDESVVALARMAVAYIPSFSVKATSGQPAASTRTVASAEPSISRTRPDAKASGSWAERNA